MISLIVIVLLIVLNGIFAMSEAAIIAARSIRLQQRVDDGDARARVALELAEDPNRFLATVQIGITMIGVLSGAFGSATLADDLSAWLAQFPFLAGSSDALAVGLIVLFTTYLSLIIGELVPKRLALLDPEDIATRVAVPMRLLSRLTAPVVWFLGVSNNAVLWLLRVEPEDRETVTDEDVRAMVRQGVAEGVFAHTEPEMIAGALSLDEIVVGSLMTPRPDVVWLNLEDSEDDLKRIIIDNERRRFLVAQGDLDNVIGFVRAKELLNRALVGKPFDVRAGLHQPIFVPETAPASRVLEMFKKSGETLGVVISEYGSVEGIITVNDIVEEVVGDVDLEDPRPFQREDGSWLVDGLLPINEFARLFDVALPDDNYFYQTVSGFVLTQLGHIPQLGEHFDWHNLRIEVLDMDGKRIDKVLVTQGQSSGEADQDE